MNRKAYSLLFLFLALSGAMIYFREYIHAINGGFSNFILNCGDFGQYSYEAYTYFRQKFIFDILAPDKEPGIFLITTIFTHIIGLSSPVSLLLQTFFGQFILLFTIGSISRTITNKNFYGLIGIVVAITLFQLSTVYVQLISRQLFSTTFALLGSSIYLFPIMTKKIPRIFLASVFLSMSFISHRFGGVIVFGGLIFCLFFDAIKFKKINYLYLFSIFLIILMTLPFIYLLLKYSFILSNSSKDIFLSNELDTKVSKFYGGFSYLVNSSNVTNLPVVHYFFYQPFYLIFVFSHLLYLVKFLNKKNLLLVNIFLSCLIYSLLKVTFSIRALVGLEIFLVPIISLSFYLNKHKFLKVLVFFSFVLIGIFGLGGRVPMTSKKIIPKDSSILFIETNFKTSSDFFLSSNRCDSEIFTQLYYSTSENLGNDSLKGISEINERDILTYNSARDIVGRNYNVLLSGRPYLHEVFRGKEIYIFFGTYTNRSVFDSLKNRSHPIFNIPYISLVYENPNARIVRYIFKLDISKMNFFNNGYYLRNLR